MAKDKGVNIKVTADAKSAQNVIQKMTSALHELSKKQIVSDISKLGSALSGVEGAFSLAINAAKSAAAAVNDTIEAYNKQAQAETQLEAAARNNPYLNAANVKKSVLSRGPLSVSVAELVIVYFAPAS